MPEFAFGPKEAQIRAKHLRNDLKKGSPEERLATLETLRLHPRYEHLSDEEILGQRQDIPLQHFQHVIAVRAGYADWSHLLRVHGRPLSQRDQQLLGVIRQFRGIFEDGWTEDDVQRVCAPLSLWVGTEMGVVWDFYDGWGASGNSDLYSIHPSPEGVRLGSAPQGLWSYLVDGEDIDPMLFWQAPLKPDPQQERSPTQVSPHNYAWAVQGVQDENLLFLEHQGLRVYQTIWESASARISDYHYQVEGTEFDVRDLPEYGTGTRNPDLWEYHKEVIRRAIDHASLDEDGVQRSEVHCPVCGYGDSEEAMEWECPSCEKRFKTEFLVTFERMTWSSDNEATVERIEAILGREADSVDFFERSVDVLFHLSEMPGTGILTALRDVPRIQNLRFGEEALG